MTIAVIIGAGMMGTAMCWPLSDNHHQVRLVGTPLDRHIIHSIQADRYHLTLQRPIPQDVAAYQVDDLPNILQDADLVVSGVSSFGVDWFAQTVGPHLNPAVPVLCVTKGLEDLPDGTLLTLPAALDRKLPRHLQGRCSLNAIGGPCIAHELAARRPTAVVFCGNDQTTLGRLHDMLATSYYHIWNSTDVTGVETCAALKNAYALGIALAAGMGELAGPDGLAHMVNPQAALFAQSIHEMRRLLRLLGASEDAISWLPGLGDLYVTVFGGRTRQLGILLGKGIPFEQARRELAGVTLESVEIITRVCRALSVQAAQGIVALQDYPLLIHLNSIINDGIPVDIPWEKFFPVKAYLTIDVGTSACKVSLFDIGGHLLHEGSASYPSYSPRPGWVEQDPQDWWLAVLKLCRSLPTLSDGSIDLRGVCVCGQTPSCLPLDEDGKPLHNAILWLDRRAEAQVTWLQARLNSHLLAQAGLNRLDSYFGGLKWLWFRQQEPDLFQNTWKFIQVNSFIQYQLTGNVVIDPSQAGLCSPCFNPTSGMWDVDVCQVMDLPPTILPEIQPSTAVIGKVTSQAARLTGLPPGVPVVCGGGDFACACLGAGVVAGGQAALMLGTAGNLLLPSQPNQDDRLLHTTHLTGQPLSFGGVLAGAALSWVKDLLDPTGRLSYAGLDLQAAAVDPGAQGLLFLPYLLGERTPIWDPQARGAFAGLSTSHAAGHLYRAVMEGVAFAFRQILEIFVSQGAVVEQLILLDGGAQSPVWRQIFADVLGLPVVWKGSHTGTGLGAAFLAALAVGDQPSFNTISDWTGTGQLQIPDHQAQKVYEALYPIYLQLYPHLKPNFQALSTLHRS